jgi:hypothetical protein
MSVKVDSLRDEIAAIAELIAQRDELLAACKAALPFVAHFRGGWSAHTPGDISSAELADQISAAIRNADGAEQVG